jgi:hypothetical protein
MVAVLLWLSVNVTPLGNVPVRVIVFAGIPVVVTVNVCPARPGVNVTVLALVMAGGRLVIFSVRSVELLAAKLASPA